MASSSDQVQFREYYQNWMIEQQQLLEELLQVHNQNQNDEQDLCCIIEKLIEHFQEYTNRRAQLAVSEPSSVFSPTWCTSTENSYLWFGGCRPSLLIQLVYTLCGSQLESQLTEYIHEVKTCNIGGLSADQLSLVSELQGRVINDEEKLSTKMVSLQENIADCPLTRIVNNNSVDSDVESHTGQVKQALDSHSKDLSSILIDSDKLRMNTLKELIGIFTPLQAVGFLIAGKKLHLCMHQWGQLRDHIPSMEEQDGEGV
ncbi:protein DELAY OF GERMINATION 1-like [Papaver somniferum]|uniref:protein DELAY OF GERMINATION 1-like n=1 Tax=Papaver somniferum TaxID=3469 RepID=UPI000E6F95B9|nr:protein DELAY OF GERMINATION 1-like [Papaver somniferum]